MAKGMCSIEGCGKPAKCRGWCSAHYERWRKNGDPTISHRFDKTDAVIRFARLWVPGESLGVAGILECKIWIGSIGHRGYGQFSLGRADGPRTVKAHRYAYQQFVGPIPKGCEIDHVCHNHDTDCPGGTVCLHRRCVNEIHLEAVLPKDHASRSPHAWANKTHCPHGHPYDEENTYIIPGSGSRSCRTCIGERSREYKRRQRERNR